MNRFIKRLMAGTLLLWFAVCPAHAWFDETHVAIAKAAGYPKWFNAAAADVARLKLGRIEGYNHFVNNRRGTVVTPDMVLAQAARYDTQNPTGHLYGAIIASLRNYRADRSAGRYAELHMAYASHYIGDLSMPLHNTVFNAFNRKHHMANDGIINDEVLENFDQIKIYPITLQSEQDLAREVARIANLSMRLGYILEDERRLMTRTEAYQQIGHSASLLKAVWSYARKKQ
ncbi:MAG: hypothetical protein KFF50_17090 [Desulfatitalea sp.]|nr:hypothetical protein [Desulfatitalea sp.]